MYVRTLGTILCSCVMESSSLSVRVCSFPVCSFSGNNIGVEGARALAESLKQNTTLTNLRLGSMSVNHALQLCDGIKLMMAHAYFIIVIDNKVDDTLASYLRRNR